jgi:hypothetical protein
MIIKICLSGFLLILSTILISCASLNAPYEEIDKLPENKGLIYFYWPEGVLRGINAKAFVFQFGKANFKISDNKKSACYVIPGGYYPYSTNTGTHQFTIGIKNRSSDPINLEIQAGQVYYVRINLIKTSFYNSMDLIPTFVIRLAEVLPEDAKKEIASIKLVE